MLKLLALAVVICVAAAATDSEWVVFKTKHGKVYQQEEDSLRRIIYEDNMQRVENHNALFAKGLKSFYLGENQFADMTTTEFAKMMNGFRSNGLSQSTENAFGNNVSLPATVDWTKKGYVTPVKNQGQCGSCWAFSTTGSLEGAHFKKTNKLVSLSEKNLMDCSRSYGNLGCSGGLMRSAFKYIIHNKGIDTEKSYPYVPKDGSCKFNRANVGATMKSFVAIKKDSEMDLQKASATVGPISVAIDASNFSFQLYKGGVYNEPQCSSVQLDHGVLVVGYGTDGGKDYWLVKNSWAASWGIKGYIKMSRNRNNQCGIATQASYPVV